MGRLMKCMYIRCNYCVNFANDELARTTMPQTIIPQQTDETPAAKVINTESSGEHHFDHLGVVKRTITTG